MAVRSSYNMSKTKTPNKSAFFSEKACKILEEIFEDDGGDNTQIVTFQPPDKNEMLAEPVENSQVVSAISAPLPIPKILKRSAKPPVVDQIVPVSTNVPTQAKAKLLPVLYRYKNCVGCIEQAPDQMSHMGYRGCLADPVDGDSDEDVDADADTDMDTK
jgi:hypothetical protein